MTHNLWNYIMGANTTHKTLVTVATRASLLVAFLLIALKFFAFSVSNSLSILSTFMDSVLDAAASLVNLFAVRRALRPADHHYRFGHGKIEAMAALGQSLLIALSALFLLFAAFHRFQDPAPLQETTVGMAVMFISILLTLVLVSFQRFVVKKTKSLAVSADSLHYYSDILINASVLLALILIQWTGALFFDALFACCIALYIIWTSFEIVSKAMSILMDREIQESDRKTITEISTSHPKVLGIHDLRTRSSGMHLFIQFHLEMEDDMPLIEAHTIAEEVELALIKSYPEAEVLIHLDPHSISYAHHPQIEQVFW